MTVVALGLGEVCIGTSVPTGETTTMSKGIAAPTANVAADVSAACTGRAVAGSLVRGLTELTNP